MSRHNANKFVNGNLSANNSLLLLLLELARCVAFQPRNRVRSTKLLLQLTLTLDRM
ncbi:hypothetical protein BTP_1799 [Burkholderia thailandensis Phuket 4W-1]|nr:hypothetical protein BTP_1799 [Burkholderia thailandensis Phuket 4W-1]